MLSICSQCLSEAVFKNLYGVDFNDKVGILGATGYAGIEVVRLLTAHPEAEIVRVVSQSFVGQKISDVYQNLKGIWRFMLYSAGY